MDKILRMLVEPAMVRGHVVLDKVEHQLEPALLHTLRRHIFRIWRTQGIKLRRFALPGGGINPVEYDGVKVEMAV